jgi:hypothetical protein
MGVDVDPRSDAVRDPVGPPMAISPLAPRFHLSSRRSPARLVPHDSTELIFIMADQSLWEFLLNLLSDPEARAEFNADPEGTLQEAGFEDVSPHDLKDAIDLVNDQSDVTYEAPEVTNDDVTAKEYIQNVVNNVENNSYTEIDSSTNIEAGGDVSIDNSVDDHSIHGDGNTSIDGDISDSNVATGEDSIAGEGNTSVDGDGNTIGDGNTTTNINGDGDNTVVGEDSNYVGDGANAAFGGGDVTNTEFNGDVNVGDGSSFAAGGSSSSVSSDDDYTDNSVSDSGNTTTEYDDSFNSNEESSSYSDDDNYSSSSDDDSYSSSSDDDSYNSEDSSSSVSAGHDVDIA